MIWFDDNSEKIVRGLVVFLFPICLVSLVLQAPAVVVALVSVFFNKREVGAVFLVFFHEDFTLPSRVLYSSSPNGSLGPWRYSCHACSGARTPGGGVDLVK